MTARQLARHSARPLARTGTYRGNTRGRRALVSIYRYPENPTGSGVDRLLRGPEQLFRVRLRRPAANFGVAILERGRGVRVQPRIVLAEDENRQAGPTALPLNTNPYLPTFGQPSPVSAVIRPAPGTYHVVFDSTTRAGSRTVHVPLLDRRRDAASAPTALAVGSARRSPDVRRLRRRLRSRPAVDLRQRRGLGQDADLCAARQPDDDHRPGRTALRPAAIACGSRSPTTRRPRTWRTRCGSCRTRP